MDPLQIKILNLKSRLESISKHFNAGNDYNPSPYNFKVSPPQTMQSYDVEPEEDDMAIGVARRKKGPVPKLLNNERCKGMFFRIIEAM